MKNIMECNKWLWQPDSQGPVYLRLSYKNLEGKKKNFTHSLNTDHLPTARKIRDSEFTPIIHSIDKAKAQLELIIGMFPQLEKQLKTGVNGNFKKDEDKGKSLKDLLKVWKSGLSTKGGNYETADATASRYSAVVDRFAAFAGKDRKIASITSQDILKYRDKRLEGDLSSKKTVDLELGALKRLFGYAVEKHGLDINPALGITVKRTRSEKNRETRVKKRRPPTHDEADNICTKFPSHKKFKPADSQDFALVARYTGMREGEITNIHMDDLRIYNNNDYSDQILKNPSSHGKAYSGSIPEGTVLCIYVKDTESRETKTGLERIIPVADKLMPAITRRFKHTAESPLFPFAAKDSCITFGRTWLKKVKTFGAELTMHGFRHYAASEMENNGAGVNVSCAILGHAPERVHGSYLHITIKAMKEAVDKIY